MPAGRPPRWLPMRMTLVVVIALGGWLVHVALPLHRPHGRMLRPRPAEREAALTKPLSPPPASPPLSPSPSPSPPLPPPLLPPPLPPPPRPPPPPPSPPPHFATAPPPSPPPSLSLAPPNPPWRSGHGDDFFDPEEKYLFYERDYKDFYAGVSHRRWSYTCMAGEAVLLRRIFVLDLEVGVAAEHNDDKETITPFALYFDLEKTRKTLPIIDMKVFQDGWAKWEALRPENKLSVLEAPITNGPPFEEIQKSNATIVHRSYGESDYAYEVCLQNPKIQRPYEAFLFAPSLLKIVWTILESMKYYFVAVHVRRGDKLLQPEIWPHLDEDTSPPHLLEVLKKKNIANGSTIYIATNEKQPGFFSPLSAHYQVRQLSDYSHLWGKSSEWWKEAKEIVGEDKEPEFDGMMAGIVDYTIYEYGKWQIETFNDLTDTPKEGVFDSKE